VILYKFFQALTKIPGFAKPSFKSIGLNYTLIYEDCMLNLTGEHLAVCRYFLISNKGYFPTGAFWDLLIL